VSGSSAERESFRLVLPYRYFALCDWLVEPSVEETNALLAVARADIAASDGRQVIICPAPDSPVTVHFEYLGARPAGITTGPDEWDGHIDLEVECPSGRIYIDQPTTQPIDLKDTLAAGPGTYAVRVARRGRQDETSPARDTPGRSGPEEYLVQMWHTGPLSPSTIEELEDLDEH